MPEEHLWEIERGLWLEGADAFAERLDPACLMAFAPAGLMSSSEALQSVKEGPRWTEVEMADARLARPAPGLAVLGYLAVAARADGEPYRALCTSTYRRDTGVWRLIQHQQTTT